MTGLAIDTSGQQLTLALWDQKEILASCSLDAGRKQAELMVPELDRLLKQTCIKINDINVVAVAAGPGSFTGLRVGIAFAKGLGLGLGIPLIALDTLDAMAWSLADFRGVASPMLDAKKGQVYTALYKHASDAPERIVEPVAIDPEEWLEGLEKGTMVYGSGVETYRRLTTQKPGLATLKTNILNPTVDGLARLASHLNSVRAFVSAEDLDANYIRPADFELKTRARQP